MTAPIGVRVAPAALAAILAGSVGCGLFFCGDECGDPVRVESGHYESTGKTMDVDRAAGTVRMARVVAGKTIVETWRIVGSSEVESYTTLTGDAGPAF